MIDTAAALGVPRDAWPDFIDRDGRPDLVSIEEVADRNRELRAAVVQLSEQQVSSNEELLSVWHHLQAGYDLFIDN